MFLRLVVKARFGGRGYRSGIRERCLTAIINERKSKGVAKPWRVAPAETQTPWVLSRSQGSAPLVKDRDKREQTGMARIGMLWGCKG